MTDIEKKEARERILETAISLFARKGFAAIGVREIAEKADVNIAMISYYFQGKVGILKSIMEQFFDIYIQNFNVIENEKADPDECLRKLIYNLVYFAKDNLELVTLVFNELPLDVPEIAKLKVQNISKIMQKIGSLVTQFQFDPTDYETLSMVMPSIIGAISMHFRIRPGMQQVFHVEPDEAYYKKYVNILTTLFLKGIYGFQSDKGVTNENAV